MFLRSHCHLDKTSPCSLDTAVCKMDEEFHNAFQDLQQRLTTVAGSTEQANQSVTDLADAMALLQDTQHNTQATLQAMTQANQDIQTTLDNSRRAQGSHMLMPSQFAGNMLDDVNQWLLRYNAYATHVGWDNARCAANIPMVLTGCAFALYNYISCIA